MRRVNVSLIAIFALSLPLLAPAAVQAEPTEIVVRVLGNDSKFIGTSMGGMRVTLRDAQTGEILATGLTQGATGDTRRIMHEDGGRRAQLSDDSAAKFVATIDLDAFAPETFTVHGREVYLHLPNGMGRSKLAVELGKGGKKAPVGTSRNWNTVLKLAELSSR